MKALAAALLCLAWALCGCGSSRPEPEPPREARLAREVAREATRRAQAGQWAPAAAAWERAAQQYALLNDRAQEAVARHNLGQALRRLERCEEALEAIELAAAINRDLGRREEWWRNQIALLQIENACGASAASANRFEALTSREEPPKDDLLRAYFDNEAGLWALRNDNGAEAAARFRAALAGFRAAEDRAGEAAAHANLALAAEARSDWTGALESWRLALPLYETLADPAGIAASLAGQGRVLVRLERNLPEAASLLQRAARNWSLLERPEAARSARLELIQALNLQGKSVEADAVRAILEGD